MCRWNCNWNRNCCMCRGCRWENQCGSWCGNRCCNYWENQCGRQQENRCGNGWGNPWAVNEVCRMCYNNGFTAGFTAGTVRTARENRDCDNNCPCS